MYILVFVHGSSVWQIVCLSQISSSCKVSRWSSRWPWYCWRATRTRSCSVTALSPSWPSSSPFYQTWASFAWSRSSARYFTWVVVALCITYPVWSSGIGLRWPQEKNRSNLTFYTYYIRFVFDIYYIKSWAYIYRHSWKCIQRMHPCFAFAVEYKTICFIFYFKWTLHPPSHPHPSFNFGIVLFTRPLSTVWWGCISGAIRWRGRGFDGVVVLTFTRAL